MARLTKLKLLEAFTGAAAAKQGGKIIFSPLDQGRAGELVGKLLDAGVLQRGAVTGVSEIREPVSPLDGMDTRYMSPEQTARIRQERSYPQIYRNVVTFVPVDKADISFDGPARTLAVSAKKISTASIQRKK